MTLPMRETLPGDPEALRTGMAEDGYLLLRGVVDADLLAAAREAVVAALERQGLARRRGDRAVAVGPADEERLGAVYAAAQRAEAFHRVPFAPELRKALDALVPPVLTHPSKVLRIIWPYHDAHRTQPHQDYPYIQGAVDTVTTWIPLHDCGREEGALRVLRGSHRGGLRPTVPVAGPGGIGIAEPESADGWVAADLAAGDAIAFHSLTVHAAAPNRGASLRLSTDSRHQSARDPVADVPLQPFPEPGGTPAWDAITAAWERDDWVRVPGSIEVVSYAWPEGDDRGWHRRLRPGPSRYAG